jgi:hypothetical protein
MMLKGKRSREADQRAASPANLQPHLLTRALAAATTAAQNLRAPTRLPTQYSTLSTRNVY